MASDRKPRIGIEFGARLRAEKNMEGNGRDAGKKDEHGSFGIAGERDVGGEATGSEGKLEGESAGRYGEMGRDLVVEQMVTCDW